MLFAVNANCSTLTRTSSSAVEQRDELIFARVTSARSTRKSVVSTCITRVFHDSAWRTLMRIDSECEVDAGSVCHNGRRNAHWILQLPQSLMLTAQRHNNAHSNYPRCWPAGQLIRVQRQAHNHAPTPLSRVLDVPGSCRCERGEGRHSVAQISALPLRRLAVVLDRSLRTLT
jgi:hypothetical protein